MVPISIVARRAGASLLAALCLAGGPVAAVEVSGAGATFPANLYAAWIEAFAAERPDARVVYEPVGSGEGIRRFLAGETDFGGTDRPLGDAEIDAGGDVLHVPATAGMVVIAYNLPGFDGELRLSRTALAGVFSGEIRYWDDPLIAATNPGADLPRRSITVVGRRDSSGTTFVFTSHLDAISDIWRISGRRAGMLVDWPGSAMMVHGNEGVAGRLAITDYAIGYVQDSFARLLDLPVAAVENRAGTFVAPTVAAGVAALDAVAADMPADGRQVSVDPAAADAYPIVSYSWILARSAYDDPEVAETLRAFLTWGLEDGQALAEPIGYIPLPASTVDRAREIVRAIR
jgi:phosphate transport system substrate-binding protein